MLDNKTKDRIHEESQQFAKENYSHKCPVAYYYSRGAESEATRAAGLVSALKNIRKKCYVEEIIDPGQLLHEIMSEVDDSLTNYNNPK